MSAIRAEEIAALTAEAWGTSLAAMRSAETCRRMPVNQFANVAIAARVCAVMLIRKHTTSGYALATRVAGREYSNTEYVEQMIGLFQRYAARRPEVMWRIEAIEQKIDEIHEARVNEKLSYLSMNCATNAHSSLEQNSAS